jgi:hypothetical protein
MYSAIRKHILTHESSLLTETALRTGLLGAIVKAFTDVVLKKFEWSVKIYFILLLKKKT